MHDQESEYDDEDEVSYPQVRPYWHRGRIRRRMERFDARHEFEIDMILAGISGAVLATLLIFGWIHR